MPENNNFTNEEMLAEDYKRYLHNFETNVDFEDEYYSDDKYYEPWVSLTAEGDAVHYNKNFKGYLRFDILSNGQIRWKSAVVSGGNITRTIEYSKNGGKWTGITSTTAGASINVSAGDVVFFRGNNQQYAEMIDPNYTTSAGDLDPCNTNNIRMVSFSGTTCDFRVSGNIMSLVKKNRAEFLKTRNLSGNCNFYGLFRVGTHLKSIENLKLPATGLTDGCYAFMFTSAATTSTMELPATVMKNSCYRNMFSDCKSLTAAPALRGTVLDEYCYSAMFARCSAIENVPSNYLPAAQLVDNCYSTMFRGCSKLKNAPVLPAMKMAKSCYLNLFRECTSLTTAPALPSMELAYGCYGQMFSGCTSLTQAPALPATTLTDRCYASMFAGCTSLVSAQSQLPAKELKEYCYNAMFSGCINLETAPDVLAETGGQQGLAPYCMENMFNGCSKINSAVCLLRDITGYVSTNNWLLNTAPSGVVYIYPGAQGWGAPGSHNLPSGWTTQDYPIE